MTFTNDEKLVLAKLSERGKLAVPTNQRLVPLDMIRGLRSLNKRGAMEMLGKGVTPPNVGAVCDVYGLTQAGMIELLSAALSSGKK